MLARFLSVALLLSGTTAWAADIGVEPSKLVVVDKQASAGKAKVTFTAKDAAITKGAATDVDGISATFTLRYGDESGSFSVAEGASNGVEGWLANDATVAKYRNRLAPGGSTTVRSTLVKPGKVVKLVANGLGEGDALDILTAGPPPGGTVSTSYCLTNGVTENCFCSTHQNCKWKSTGGGSGATLSCKGGEPDPICAATAVPCQADVGGHCWFGPNAEEDPWSDCDTTCGSYGRVYDSATATYAGSGGTDANCLAVLQALFGSSTPPFEPSADCTNIGGLGCGGSADDFVTFRCATPPTTSSAPGQEFLYFRVCACQ